MGLTAAILGALGAIAAALGVINILEVLTDPIISDKLNWVFWMYISIILILGAIAFLLGRRPNIQD